MQFKKTFTEPVPENQERGYVNAGITPFHGRNCDFGSERYFMSKSTVRFLLVVLALSLLAFSIGVKAKPRSVDLKEELRLATIITPAKIVSYDQNLLRFQPIGNTAILSARYSTDPTWNPSRFVHSEWPPTSEKTTLSAEWPPVGAEVLVVVDKDNVISLFAWSLDDDYRFWSPMKTGSVAVFNCKPLGVAFDLLSKDNPDIGWDGCLVKKTKVTTKGIIRPPRRR
jgi:hypothetical protein